MDEIEKKACLLYFKHMYNQNNKHIFGSLQCTPFHTAIAAGNTDTVKDLLDMIEIEDKTEEVDRVMDEDGKKEGQRNELCKDTSQSQPLHDYKPSERATYHSARKDKDKSKESADYSSNTEDGQNPDFQVCYESCQADNIKPRVAFNCVQPLSLMEFVLGSPVSFTPSSTSADTLSCEYVMSIHHQLSAADLMHLLNVGELPVTLGFYKTCSWDAMQFPSCLSLALGSGETELVRVLIQETGCDVLQQDQRGNSCVHHLVHLCELNPSTAVSMYRQLCQLLETNKLKFLLALKNHSGFTALDLAAELCQPEILQAIINTQQVYRHDIKAFGCKRFVLYDVSEYEDKHSKVENSLLFKLTDMTESQVIRAQKCKLFTSEPFSTWCQFKMKSQRLPVGLCFGYWLSFVLIFYLCIVNKEEGAWLIVPMVLYSLLFIFIEMMFIKTTCKELVRSFKQVFYQKRFPVTFTLAYRLVQMMFAVGNLMVLVLTPFDDISAALLVVNSLTGILSLLFFFQLNPSMGHMLMVSQKMFMDVFVFFLMVFVFFFGFSASFYMLGITDAPAVGTNGTDSVVEASSLATVSYTTFLFMLNIATPVDMFFSHTMQPNLSMTLFVVMVIVISIVQLNMVIAIMSCRLDEINKCKHEIFWLEKLCIIMYIEQRINTRLGRWLFRKLRQCSCARSNTQTIEGLSYSPDKSKVYLQVVERVAPKLNGYNE